MADPVISVKLIVLYRFLSHNFPRSKTMWFLANSSIWHRKMLLNLTIPHPTTSLNVFLSQFPSFSSCLEQRTVRNTRGPFLVLFSFMKEQVFVPKTPNIFAIMTGPPSTIVQCQVNYQQKGGYEAILKYCRKGTGFDPSSGACNNLMSSCIIGM